MMFFVFFYIYNILVSVSLGMIYNLPVLSARGRVAIVVQRLRLQQMVERGADNAKVHGSIPCSSNFCPILGVHRR